MIIYCCWSRKSVIFLGNKDKKLSTAGTEKLAIMKTYAVDPIAVVEPVIPLTCRKSSSISNTLANSDFDDRSFNSSSFIRLLSIIVFLVIFLPGRLIRKIHGSH